MVSDELAQTWAKNLILTYNSNLIASPVVIEFLVGAHSSDELRAYRAFLAEFVVLDEGQIKKEVWERAKALAERIPIDGKPRDLGDCLIRAIADHFNKEVVTKDRSFPRRRQ